MRDPVTKRREYAEAAIPEYWIVDPEMETVTVLGLEGTTYAERGCLRPRRDRPLGVLAGPDRRSPSRRPSPRTIPTERCLGLPDRSGEQRGHRCERRQATAALSGGRSRRRRAGVLRELSKHSAQLGDLAPDPAQCATLADEIERTSSALVRLDALRGYLSAWRGAREESALALIDRGHREAIARIDAGRLAADNVQNLTKFVDARGQAVSDGIAQARALKDKPIA